MSRYELSNGVIGISVDSFGAELRSLRRLAEGTEYMWNADPAYWKRTSPVLFPLVGSLNGKQYTYDGAVYPMSQHGFARDMEFTLTRQSDSALWFSLHESEETMKMYPFPFTLQIGYELDGAKVYVHWQVENTGQRIMYFSIGGHPAFLCPIDSGSRQTDYLIGFDAKEDTIVSSVIGRDGLLSGRKKTYALDGGALPIDGNLFDEDALIIEHDQAHRVSLMTKERKPYLTVSFDAPLFGIWSPPRRNAPFICIEPWYGRCDAESFCGTLGQREWGNSLEAGESFRSVYTVEV